MNQKKWICMDCGRIIYFPSVDPETRAVICTDCRAPALEEIPREQLAAKAVMA